jgi:hypothetical protein
MPPATKRTNKKFPKDYEYSSDSSSSDETPVKPVRVKKVEPYLTRDELLEKVKLLERKHRSLKTAIKKQCEFFTSLTKF